MRMKLIVALVNDDRTEAVLEAGRAEGATGATIITSARGEGMEPRKTFLGLQFEAQRDLVLFIVADTRSRYILEGIRDAGRFDDDSGAGIAFQVDIEDAVGLGSQLSAIRDEVKQEI